MRATSRAASPRNQRRPRLLVLTSTFPRWPEDTEPPFVYELSRRLTDRFEITVTSGMNLGCAAWNNPALTALIVMVRGLTEGPIALGAVHGNGGLGYRQGVALLARIEPGR